MPSLALLWAYASVLLAGALLWTGVLAARRTLLRRTPAAPGAGSACDAAGGADADAAGPPGRAGLLARVLLLGPLGITLSMLALHLAGLRFSLAAICVPWWLAALVFRRELWATLKPAAACRSVPRRVLLVLAGGLFALALVVGLRTPVYSGDGLDNVALAARVFETSGSFDFELLARLPGVGGTSYPPLVAANEALVFMASGEQRARDIKPLFALAWLAYLLLVIELAFRHLPPRHAWLAALPFLTLPLAGSHAVIGYTDLHLTALLLLLCLELRDPVALALVAGACALTKNEGLVVAGASGLMLLLPGPWLRSGARSSARTLAVALCLLIPLASAWPLLKAWHGLHSVHMQAGGELSLGELLPRLSNIARAFGARLISSGQARYSVHAPLALLTAGLALAAARARGCGALLCWLGVFVAHVGLYAAVLVRHPLGSDWQLNVAAGRLMLHTTPWLLLLLLLSLKRLSAGRLTESAGPVRDTVCGSPTTSLGRPRRAIR
ncbi:MAG: hypothetical protein DRQ55_11925 [Planctomycetota bacterium]|nr:MAG: hypothetical protein DRQ55_11925 [Planctomycetota bacterium]